MLSVCKKQSVLLCTSPGNVWEECRRKENDDLNVDPIDSAEEGEVARYHVVES